MEISNMKYILKNVCIILLFLIIITAKNEHCGNFVENALIHEMVRGFSYSCGSDYKALNGKWWGVVTCTEPKQTDTPQCICKLFNFFLEHVIVLMWNERLFTVNKLCLVITVKDQCSPIPHVQAKHNKGKKVYENGDTTEIECESEPCCVRCNDGTWEKEACNCKTFLSFI